MDQPHYNAKVIEPYWQAWWEEHGLYRTEFAPALIKHYALTMLPYPSGDLHIGHWYAIVPSDARARFKRMMGRNVFFPMGFDAFGLPAENAAISRNFHPKEWTYTNIRRMRLQLQRMGTMIDWQREAISSDPKYYRWTQWFFIKFFQNDLAYRKQSFVDWCPSCNTTLAREQVIGNDRICERCQSAVTRKHLTQWFFRITRYADELLRFDSVDWPDRVKTLQQNWIGRSEGVRVMFSTDFGQPIEVFTSRPETLWGVTFLAVAPEHSLVSHISKLSNSSRIEAYLAVSLRRADLERQVMNNKTGCFTGRYAFNPVDGRPIPIWIADYVLPEYGTGAIMGVPAHDERDFDFACQHGLDVKQVVRSRDPEAASHSPAPSLQLAGGFLVDSGPLTGTPSEGAYEAAVAYLEANHIGERAVVYRLRDWLISRQRYWGAPIPVVYCGECGSVPVPETDLPVHLPDDIEWRPTGESPLKLHPTWKHTQCPNCKRPAERETDTMDTFVCSSWYHLRYLSPDFDQGPFDPTEYEYWMPVDTYTGGIEHATMHLVYTRFFHKACRDLGIVSGDEPMLQLRNQGIILGEDSEKMSKSRGNVVAPDELVERFGADAVRCYLMFFARWEHGGPWSSRGIAGVSRWLQRVWRLLMPRSNEGGSPPPPLVKTLRTKLHRTLRDVTRSFEDFHFNKTVSALMDLSNDLSQLARVPGLTQSDAWTEARDIYVQMLAPIAPHFAEELWHRFGHENSVHLEKWPALDEAAVRDDELTFVVQVNGKLRGRITVAAVTSEAEILRLALTDEKVRRSLKGKSITTTKVVPGRLVNFIVS